MGNTDYAKVYAIAYNKLKAIAQEAGLTEKQREEYLDPDHILKWYQKLGLQVESKDDIKFIMCRLVNSLINKRGANNSIKFEANFNLIKKCLLDFQPQLILSEIGSSQEIYNRFLDTGLNFMKSQNTWNDFSKGIYDAAVFLSNFKSGKSFNRFIDKIFSFIYDIGKNEEYDIKLQEQILVFALAPIYENIHGMGYALAADFIKEIGTEQIGKPDTHIIDVLTKTGICKSNSPAKVQSALRMIAEAAQVTPYRLDKVLWLVCSPKSNKFYMHPNHKVKNPGKHKDDLIETLCKELGSHNAGKCNC